MPQNRSKKVPTYLAETISVASVAPAYKRKTIHFFQPMTSHSTGVLSCDWLNSMAGKNFVVLLYASTPVLWKNF